MNIVLLANIISFSGSLIMIAIGLIKEKRKILLAQCGQFALMGAGNVLLGGITGGIANGVSILRNVLCLYVPFTLPWKIGFVVLQGALSLAMNREGLIGWLPFFAACIYTMSLSTKDEKLLKWVMIAGQAAWVIYDLTIKNYAGFVFDILTIFSNLAGIFMLMRRGRRKK